MEFLLADGVIHKFSNVLTAEVEDGVLVGRNRSGAFVVAFARPEVMACAESLQLMAASGDRRVSPRRVE